MSFFHDLIRGGTTPNRNLRWEQEPGQLLTAKLRLLQTNDLRMGEIKACSPLFNPPTCQSGHALGHVLWFNTCGVFSFLQGWRRGAVFLLCFHGDWLLTGSTGWLRSQQHNGDASCRDSADRRNGIIPSHLRKGEFPALQREGGRMTHGLMVPTSLHLSGCPGSTARYQMEENDIKPLPSFPVWVPWNWSMVWVPCTLLWCLMLSPWSSWTEWHLPND